MANEFARSFLASKWASDPVLGPTSIIVSIVAVLIIAVTWSSSKSKPDNLPTANPSTSWTNTETVKTFVSSGKEILDQARVRFSGMPYRMITDLGNVIVLPADLGDEVRNKPQLSFIATILEDLHGHIPGFEGVNAGARGDDIIQKVIKKQLAKYLTKVTKPLSDETAFAVAKNLGQPTDWIRVAIQPCLLDIVARMSARIFLGEELCRNEDWLRISKEYTVASFIAASKLRLAPRWSRSLVHWFMPSCKELRKLMTEARCIIEPYIEKRVRLEAEALAKGEPTPEYEDAFEWAKAEAIGPNSYDPVTFQLNLSVVAIHTTNDLLKQVMIDLVEHPQFIKPLRDEMVNVVRSEGWKKSSLFNMKLVDSAVKETQRRKPINTISMRRIVQAPLKLSAGLELKRGERIVVDGGRMWDPQVYPDPNSYNPYRFLAMRDQPGKESQAHLVSTSVNHLGFGHGEHACPGRFFAANEVKIALSHLWLKYDWRLAPGTVTQPLFNGFEWDSNPSAELLVRRRPSMEIDIDAI